MADITKVSPSTEEAQPTGDVKEREVATKNDDETKKPTKVNMAGYFELFRYGDALDITYMLFGSLMAIGYGCIQPVISIMLGGVTTAFLDYGSLLLKMQMSGTFDPVLVEAAKKNIEDQIIYNIYLFLGIGAAAFLAAYLTQSLWITAGERQARRVRKLFLLSILNQDVSFFDENEVGDLTTRLSSDTTLYQEGISEKVGFALSSMGTFVSGFVIAFVKGPVLTGVLLATTPLLLGAGFIVGTAIASGTEQSQQAYASAGAVAQETLANIRTVFAFNGQERAIEKFSKLMVSALAVNEKKAWKTGFGFGLFFSLLYGIYALAFWYGSILVNDGKMNGGDILNVIFSVIIGAFSTISLAPSIQAINKARGVARKLFDVIEKKPMIKSMNDDGELLKDVKGRIEFKNVSFEYPNRPGIRALDNFSLVVEPGQTVALVGFSGSGKSTTIQLLERFYDPLEGDILIDGISLKNVNVRSLRQNVGLVSQEPILFDASIEENIRLGAIDSEKVTMEQIIEATKAGNAHDFVSKLPQGYKTQTGEKGSLLSGGQKQRIAISRALLKNPKILLLDEATSALDTESERIVQKALEVASMNRTTIVIAHRLSTIKNADLIVVMDKGKIVESGKHADLLLKKSYYADLVRAQELKTTQDKPDGDERLIKAKSDEIKPEENKIDKKVDVEPELTPEEIEKKKQEEIKLLLKTHGTPLWRIFKMQKPEAFYLVIAFLTAGCNGAILPSFGLIFGQVLGVFSYRGQKLLDEAAYWAYVFLGLMGANFVINLVQFGTLGISGERLTKRIREQSFRAMLKQDVKFFDDKKNGTGVLTSRLSEDPEKISLLTGPIMGNIFQLIVSMTLAIIYAFYYSWQMTLVVLAIVPILALSGILETQATWAMSNNPEVRKSYEKASQTACDAIANIRTVKSLTAEEKMLDSYMESTLLPYKLGVRRAFVASWGFGFSQGVQFWIYGAAFYAGYRFIFDDNIKLSPSNMFTCLFSIIFGAIAFSQAAMFLSNLTKARVAAINFFSLVDSTSIVDPYSTEGERPDKISGVVSLKDVKFAYPQRPDAPILKGISANIAAAQNVALVGPSGSGKSTIIALLERFYEATEGDVFVESVPVPKWNVSYLRSQMSIVSQEPTLFIGTIAENISYGRPNASQDEIENAAKMANIHDFIITLPTGYKTEISNSQLSGGQKQRIAIARALLCQPKILLLDEATSALDSESEKVVQAALVNASKGRTTFTIAHRLSTIQDADLIIVMRDGVVVEEGRHFELLEKRGLYSTLVDRQKLGN